MHLRALVTLLSLLVSKDEKLSLFDIIVNYFFFFLAASRIKRFPHEGSYSS